MNWTRSPRRTWGWLIGLIGLIGLYAPTQAQELQRHGEVVQVRGETVEVRLGGTYEGIREGEGTVFVQDTLGGTEQQVPVATMAVEAVQERVVTGRITDQTGFADLQTGQSVFFPGAQRTRQRSAPTYGVLRLTSAPSGVDVEVQSLRASATGRTIHQDPRSLGATPLTDSLLPGRYRLTLRAEEYSTARRSVVVRPDSVVSESVQLERRQGTLVVQAQPDSAVISVDGQRAGRGQVEQSVDVGQHRIRVSAAGHHPTAETLRVSKGEEHSLDVSLDRRMGTLTVTSMPEEATVQIGGTDVGRSPVTVERPPGTYEVRVAASQYEPHTETVTVESGEETTVTTSLRRPIQVQLASSHGPGVQNAQLERDGDWVVVQYDLQGDADEYDVTLRLSDERGQSFSTELKTVRGDVGDEVTAGSGQEIRWAALEDYPRGLIGENFRLRVATDPEGGNGVLYVLGSMVVGGGVTAAVLTLQGGGAGSSDGSGGSDGTGGEIPIPPSPPN